MTVIGGAVAAPLLGALKTFSDYGGMLDDISKRTGISVEALSELGYAARRSGTNLEAIEKSARKMQQTIADAANGSSSAAETLRMLGLQVEQLQQLSPEQQFEKFVNNWIVSKTPQ